MTHSFMRILVKATVAVSAMTMAMPASATETSFAVYTGLGLSLVAVNSGTAAGSLTITDMSTVNFSFLTTNQAAAVSNISANLVLTASSANSNYNKMFANNGVAYQPNFAGSLSITSTQAFTVGSSYYAAGSNLLSATFSNASLLGVLGQKNAGLTSDSETGTLIYTSDFLTFANTISRDFSFAFGAITPPLTSGLVNSQPAYLQSFTATPTGSFASDPGPLSTAVPEPATWAMMLIGLGGIGLSLRGNARRGVRLA